MRGLRALLAAFGFALGLLMFAAWGLIDTLTAEPVRINYNFEGTESSVSWAIPVETIILAIALPLVGALAGWLIGLVATRRGWRIQRAS